MNTELEVEDQVSDQEKWHRRLRAAGVYEREQERQRFLVTLCISLGINSDEANEPFTFEEWLRETVYFKHHNGCSLLFAQLRQLDRWLWEYDHIPFSENAVMSYLFDWDDVVRVQTTGQATTYEEWERLVDDRYHREWQEHKARYSQWQKNLAHGEDSEDLL